MNEVAFIERTGRKRRRKRMLIVGFALLALALGGAMTLLLGPATPPAPDETAAVPPPEPEPVTADEANLAMAEADSMQTLVSNLGDAVSTAGIQDMKALEDLMAQAVVVSTAADQMVEAVEYEDELLGRTARKQYQTAVDDSKKPLATLLEQLEAAGVDTRPLVAMTKTAR